MNLEVRNLDVKPDVLRQYESTTGQENPLQQKDIEKLFLEAQEIFCRRMESSSSSIFLQTRNIDVLDSSQPEWKGASQDEIKFVKKLLAKEAEEDSLDKLVRITQGVKTLHEELSSLEGAKVRIRHIRKKFNVHADYPPREKALILFFNTLQSTKTEFNEVNTHYEKILKNSYLDRDLTSTEQLLIRRALKVDFLISKKESLEKVYNEKLKNIKVKDPKFKIDWDEKIILPKRTPIENPFMFLNMGKLLGPNIENLLDTTEGK